MSRSALITGISGAIGHRLGQLLIKDGWTVFGTYHDHPSESPESATCFHWSSDNLQQSTRQLATNIESRIDCLDGLVHCAGMAQNQSIALMSADQFKQHRKIHLDAVYHLVRGLQSTLSADSTCSPSHVVLLSSRVGLNGNQGQSHYAAAKSGLLGLITSLAREWNDDPLINAIRPAFTESTMTENMDEDAHRQALQQIHTGQIADPGQTAGQIRWLLDQSNVTGQLISTDHRSPPTGYT